MSAQGPLTCAETTELVNILIDLIRNDVEGLGSEVKSQLENFKSFNGPKRIREARKAFLDTALQLIHDGAAAFRNNDDTSEESQDGASRDEDQRKISKVRGLIQRIDYDGLVAVNERVSSQV